MTAEVGWWASALAAEPRRGVTLGEVEILALVARLLGADAVRAVVSEMRVTNPADAVGYALDMAAAYAPRVRH